jgi:hypothetical protein
MKDIMQVKVFMDSDAKAIEARINEWLENLAGPPTEAALKESRR